MIYAYIRVSTDKQSVENQRFEILKYADAKKITIGAFLLIATKMYNRKHIVE